jgi:uncharacterized Zn finger protein (UPF0148 family)
MDSARSSDEGTEGKPNMKDAASFLLRGGSLLSSPCATCNGVQIKYKNEIFCINCGKQEPAGKINSKSASDHQENNVGNQFRDLESIHVCDFEEEIEERIAEQFKILKIASDNLDHEKQRVELIGMYLDLLDRLRKDPKKLKE